jgi:hypothetical protein
MQTSNYSMNETVQSKKPFKNPSIYETFIENYKIDEFGSNFPMVNILITDCFKMF